MSKGRGCACAGGAPPMKPIPTQPTSLFSGIPSNNQGVGIPARSGSQPSQRTTQTRISREIAKGSEKITSPTGPQLSKSTLEIPETPIKKSASLARKEREAKLEKLKKWVSPLKKFDTFASNELRRREIAEEDFPKLKVPNVKGHKCRVSAIIKHSVDYGMELETELRNVGIQDPRMLDMLEKLTMAESACRFQGAVRAAEIAAMSAPPEMAEEAALAGARGYTMETHEISKKSFSSSNADNPIEIIGYIGCTRPTF